MSFRNIHAYIIFFLFCFVYLNFCQRFLSIRGLSRLSLFSSLSPWSCLSFFLFPTFLRASTNWRDSFTLFYFYFYFILFLVHGSLLTLHSTKNDNEDDPFGLISLYYVTILLFRANHFQCSYVSNHPTTLFTGSRSLSRLVA